MLCDKCHKNEAAIYVTELTPEGRVEHHLCEQCAARLGLLSEKNNVFSINDFLSGIFNHNSRSDAEAASDQVNLKNQLVCPKCGMSYADFTRTGKIGCSVCYKTFGSRLEPLLRRIHGSTSHIGKIPRRAGGTLGMKKEIGELRRKIAKHIEAEEYEQAAVLRDRIKMLEAELNSKIDEQKGGSSDD